MKTNLLIYLFILCSVMVYGQEKDDSSIVKYNDDRVNINVSYPELAREKGIKGRVFYRIKINESGCVVSIEVLSSPNELLSEAVLKAVKQTKCKWSVTESSYEREKWYYLDLNFHLL